MTVLQNGRALQLVRLEIQLDEFPQLLQLGIDEGRLFETESLAQDLIRDDFPESASRDFVKAVCLWGGDPRRGGKVIRRNSPQEISSALRNAYLCSRGNELREALHAITALAGLAVSFGSKHLKFLDPNKHVVLDSIISERLGYTRDIEGNGYLAWVATCNAFLKIVRANRINYPPNGPNGWRVSDIEMAIFNKIRRE